MVQPGQIYPPSVRGNLLLRSLTPADAQLISPHLSRHFYSEGEVLASPEVSLATVYFPETITLAFHEASRADRPQIVGMVGLEGMVGWPTLMGIGWSPLSAIVQMQGGTALRISVEWLLAACAASATMRFALLRYAHNFMSQMACTIASNACDAMERRVARWLLMLHDRTEGDILDVTHDSVGQALHVRRATVTDCLHLLEGDHILRCTRGRIEIRDRVKLRQIAGTSYGGVEASYASEIGHFGKCLQ